MNSRPKTAQQMDSHSTSKPLSAKPLLLLDIDGVISPLPRRGGGGEVKVKYTDGTTKTTSARWGLVAWDDGIAYEDQYYFASGICMETPFSEFMMEQLAYIIQEDVCDVGWLTTWDTIPSSLRRLEHLIWKFDFDTPPTLPIISRPKINNKMESNKALAVTTLALSDPKRQIIWVDDDAHSVEVPENVLVIAPDSLVGIRLRHIEKIRKTLGLKTWAETLAD